MANKGTVIVTGGSQGIGAAVVQSFLKRGYADGTFTRHVDAIDLHMMISAFCVFRISNQHTFGVVFDRDLTSPGLRDGYRQMLGDMIVSYLVSG